MIILPLPVDPEDAGAGEGAMDFSVNGPGILCVDCVSLRAAMTTCHNVA